MVYGVNTKKEKYPCKKCGKLGHRARECTVSDDSEHIIAVEKKEGERNPKEKITVNS